MIYSLKVYSCDVSTSNINNDSVADYCKEHDKLSTLCTAYFMHSMRNV
jgi:hypothetical protein